METTNTVILIKKGGAFLLTGSQSGDMSIVPVANIEELCTLIAPQNVELKIDTPKLVFFTLKADV